MYCPYCGAPNGEGAQVCINCRRPLVAVAPTAQYYNYNAYNAYNAAPLYAPLYPTVAGLPGQLAGFWLRFGAWLIDAIIIGLATTLAFAIPLAVWFGSFWQKYGSDLTSGCTSNNPRLSQECEIIINQALQNEAATLVAIIGGAGLLALIVYLFYYVGLTASGSTLGKKLFGLKVVKGDGSVPGLWVALFRQTIGYGLSGTFFALGFIWAGFDNRRQAWHDKLAQTYVIRL